MNIRKAVASYNQLVAENALATGQLLDPSALIPVPEAGATNLCVVIPIPNFATACPKPGLPSAPI